MSEIRKYFTSRFDDGWILEFDFSQLEVVALAQLSKDKTLIQDILDGADLHRRSASLWLGKHESVVTEGERKKAKQMTFQLQYGAGYKSMAKKLDLPMSETRAFIDAYYLRYSGVKAWQQENMELVAAARSVAHGRKTPKGNPQGISKIQTETGRIYTFKERDLDGMYIKSPTGFWATEIKNYFVQGFATGDIVPLMLGVIWRALKNNEEIDTDKILLVNTVHDSIVFDVFDIAHAEQCRDFVLPIMNNTNRYIKKTWNIDMVVPIKADCKIGRNWMKMKDFTA